MPYFVTPNDNYQLTATVNFGKSDFAARLMLLLFSFGLGVLVATVLLMVVIPAGADPGAVWRLGGVTSILLGIPAIAGPVILMVLIKYMMLKRMGGKPELGYVRLNAYYNRGRDGIYLYIYAPNLYLTRSEILRLNVLPLAAIVPVVAVLLIFAPVVIRLDVLLAVIILTVFAVFVAITVANVLRFPPDTLFIESSEGDLRVFTTIGPG